MLAGKPLIALTIEQAKQSKYLDRCIVSTEDEEICAVAEQYGGDVPFLRPAQLAQDDTPSIAPVLHAIHILSEYDYVVLLQVTSPLRSVEDIDQAIAYCMDQQADSCVSVVEAGVSPYWMYTMADDGRMNPVLPMAKEEGYQRQKLPKVYQLNGAVYVASREFLIKVKDFQNEETLGYIMPTERSFDIDTLMDFYIAEALKKGHRL
jgi:N-acylneuraminate cytidylyltransferase